MKCGGRIVHIEAKRENDRERQKERYTYRERGRERLLCIVSMYYVCY